MMRGCRQAMGGGFDWGAVESRLRLHGLWSAEVERGLNTCEIIMLTEEMKHRETKPKKSDK